MTFPWSNKKINHDEGTLSVTGQGETLIIIHFQPDNLEFDVLGNSGDPTPLSADPNPVDSVTCKLQHRTKHAPYEIVITWNVFGTKYVKWSVNG